MGETPPATAETKLTRTEFAVIRAYAQGMSPVDIARRYLSDPDDEDHLSEAEAIRKIMALRDRLIQFALQHRRPDIAQMFEALRARSDVGMTRRVEALASLESLGQTRPHPDHEVGLWFRLSLVRRLNAAGLRRISDLIELANRRGSSWWRWAPGIGPKSAETITRWLLARQSGAPAGAALIRPYVRPPSEAGKVVPGPRLALGRAMPHPVPLERMLPPADGGPIADDLRTVRQWLQAGRLRPNTVLSYRREAERLLLWLARAGLYLEALSRDDLDRYGQFLLKPAPTDFWCGPATVRNHVDWRPFEGPLSPPSVAASMRVVAALIRWRAKAVGPLPRVALAAQSRHEALDSAASDRRPKPEHVEMFMAWLKEMARSSPRFRAAQVAACLVRREKMSIDHICFATCNDIPGAGMRHAGKSSDAGAGRHPLHADTAAAIRGHWQDRLAAGQPPGRTAALLAPLELPRTARGHAKRAAEGGSGYSRAGLEKLLRWSWKRFAATQGLPDLRFTPKCLRMVASEHSRHSGESDPIRTG